MALFLFVGPIYSGKRGPKVYPKKDEASDECKRASSFFKAQCDTSDVHAESCLVTGPDFVNLEENQEDIDYVFTRNVDYVFTVFESLEKFFSCLSDFLN